jgi:MYXO-CTERM domain-containing protein
VSGDGTSGSAATQAARDAALTAGVTRINALAIGGQFIFDFFQNNVIGGPGAFVLQATSFDEFGQAIANKIQVEVGGPDPVDVPAPGAIGFLGLGVLALGLAIRRRRSA